MDEDPFDLENLRLDPAESAAIAAKQAAKKTKSAHPRKAEPFTKFPDTWEAALRKSGGSAYRLAIYILRRTWETKGQPVPMTNVALSARGVSREEKRKALQELEALGLVVVTRRGKGAVAICVGIDFGAISSVTILPHHAARSKI